MSRLPSIFGSSHFDTQQLTPFYNQMAAAIRSVDPTTPGFYEPNLTFDVGLPTHLGSIDDHNSVFSFHDYCVQAVVADVGFGCDVTAGAVIDNVDDAVAQALAIATRGTVVARDGGTVSLRADTICVHGDRPDAAHFARRLREALDGAGVRVESLHA